MLTVNQTDVINIKLIVRSTQGRPLVRKCMYTILEVNLFAKPYKKMLVSFQFILPFYSYLCNC